MPSHIWTSLCSSPFIPDPRHYREYVLANNSSQTKCLHLLVLPHQIQYWLRICWIRDRLAQITAGMWLSLLHWNRHFWEDMEEQQDKSIESRVQWSSGHPGEGAGRCDSFLIRHTIPPINAKHPHLLLNQCAILIFFLIGGGPQEVLLRNTCSFLVLRDCASPVFVV